MTEIDKLTAPERFYGPLAVFKMRPGERGDWVRYSDYESIAKQLAEAQAEIDRCHTRLEIDHFFIGDADENGMVRIEVPMSDRLDQEDGIECRDATIKGQDEQISRLHQELVSTRCKLDFARFLLSRSLYKHQPASLEQHKQEVAAFLEGK